MYKIRQNQSLRQKAHSQATGFQDSTAVTPVDARSNTNTANMFDTAPLLPTEGPLAGRDVLRLQRTIGNQAVIRRLNEQTQGALRNTTQPPAGQIQRTIRLNKKVIRPKQFKAFREEVIKAADILGLQWDSKLNKKLDEWLTSRDFSCEFDTLMDMLFAFNGDESTLDATKKVPIKKEDLEKGQFRRKQERVGLTMEPYEVDTPGLVPGMSKIGDDELLRLGDIGKEEEEHWVRTSDDDLHLFKRRGIKKEEEHRVIASGDKDDPSYVVWYPVGKNAFQRGHRYKGGGGKNDSHNRTYGSKQALAGEVYKITGAVDGHSIQAQDNKLVLGPFKTDVLHWTTTVNTTDGKTVTYKDGEYLPKDEKDTVYIEIHPYNMYWENQMQGKSLRQKAIESPALKNKTSFLHYSDFRGGETANPNTSKSSTHIYPVPDTIHYLIVDEKGTLSHHQVDNRLKADYSDPEGFDDTTYKYPDVTGKLGANVNNRTLGGVSAFDHLKKTKRPDTKQYPKAKVVYYGDKTKLDFVPSWRNDKKKLSGYESPDSSPFHVPQYLEDEVKKVKGRHIVGEMIDDKLVTEARYDKVKNETEVKLTHVPESDFEKMFKALDMPAITKQLEEKGVKLPEHKKPKIEKKEEK